MEPSKKVRYKMRMQPTKDGPRQTGLYNLTLKGMICLRTKSNLLKAAYYLFNSICFYFVLSRSLDLPIQGDEAGTYLRHAVGGAGSLFDLGTANNHFLNTLLIKITTFKAEFSEFAIRLPTVVFYAWFYFWYAPKRLLGKDWASKIIFSSLSLFPYYFHEYASMARGYVMSSIFACCAINELSLSSDLGGEGNIFPNKGRINLFASLSALSSIITFPLFVVLLISPFALAKQRLNNLCKCLSMDAQAFALVLGTSILTVYTFLGIKLSGVGTINAPRESLGHWIVGVKDILWLPVSSVADSFGSSSSAFAIAVTVLSWVALILSLNSGLLKQSIRISIWCLFASLFLLYILALTGNYPVGRGLIPYWLPICFISTVWLSPWSYSSDIGVLNFKLKGFIPVRPILALLLLGGATANLIISYESRYVNELRPFYYQYKSLMHYSRNQDLQCLSYGDINDEVLKFYFLNPNGPVPKPEECPHGGKSQYGFMPFNLDNREPMFINPQPDEK